jgi:hypothetical protein
MNKEGSTIHLSRILLGAFLLSLFAANLIAVAGAAPVETALSLSSSPNPALTTDEVTLSGTLTANGKGVATQEIEFQYSENAKKWIKSATTITGSDGQFSANWKAPSQGDYYLRAVYSGGKQYRSSTSNVITQTAVQATTDPPIPDPETPPVPETKSAMYAGVCDLLTPARASFVKAAGITWIRSDVRFNTDFETTYSSAVQYGIAVIGILDYKTLEYDSSFTLQDWIGVASKAQTMFPAIHVWEIWNEPTVPHFQLGYQDGTPQNYFALLKSGYQALKSRDPNAIVLGLGGAQFGSSGDYRFAQSVFSLGGGDFMDAISVHAYPYQLNTGQTWDYYKQLWSNELSRYKQFGKPIWVTETGLKSTQNSESDQSTYLQESFQFFNAQGVVAYMWFQLKDYVSSSGDLVTWGVLRSDSTAKLAYTTYQALLSA